MRQPYRRSRFAGALIRHLLGDLTAQASRFLHHPIEPSEHVFELARRQSGFLDTRHDAANDTAAALRRKAHRTKQLAD
jgi:hypothetical protein